MKRGPRGSLIGRHACRLASRTLMQGETAMAKGQMRSNKEKKKPKQDKNKKQKGAPAPTPFAGAATGKK